MTLALAMVRHRAKIAIIHAGTNIPRRTLRTLYHAVHGESPSSGPIATTAAHILKSRPQHASASLYASLYLRSGGGEIYRAVAWRALVDAYDIYMGLARATTGTLDINQAWALATDFKAARATLGSCEQCHVPFLVVAASPFGATCPFCSLYGRA